MLDNKKDNLEHLDNDVENENDNEEQNMSSDDQSNYYENDILLASSQEISATLEIETDEDENEDNNEIINKVSLINFGKLTSLLYNKKFIRAVTYFLGASIIVTSSLAGYIGSKYQYASKQVERQQIINKVGALSQVKPVMKNYFSAKDALGLAKTSKIDLMDLVDTSNLNSEYDYSLEITKDSIAKTDGTITNLLFNIYMKGTKLLLASQKIAELSGFGTQENNVVVNLADSENKYYNFLLDHDIKIQPKPADLEALKKFSVLDVVTKLDTTEEASRYFEIVHKKQAISKNEKLIFQAKDDKPLIKANLQTGELMIFVTLIGQIDSEQINIGKYIPVEGYRAQTLADKANAIASKITEGRYYDESRLQAVKTVFDVNPVNAVLTWSPSKLRNDAEFKKMFRGLKPEYGSVKDEYTVDFALVPGSQNDQIGLLNVKLTYRLPRLSAKVLAALEGKSTFETVIELITFKPNDPQLLQQPSPEDVAKAKAAAENAANAQNSNSDSATNSQAQGSGQNGTPAETPANNGNTTPNSSPAPAANANGQGSNTQG